MITRMLDTLQARIAALEAAGLPAAAAVPAGLTPEEESARIAKIYEDLKAALKADLDAMVLSAKAELQAFVTSQVPAPAPAPAPSSGRKGRGSPAPAPSPIEDAAPAPTDA